MIRFGLLLWAIALAMPGLAFKAHPEQPAYLPAYSRVFDTARDPQADYALALEAARGRQQPVLIMVGGDGCVWCFFLDRHLNMDAEAAELFYGGFEVLRVFWGEDNTNAQFLSRFPDFRLFPHFFVVAPSGELKGSVLADVLIRNARYDNELIRAFVDRWNAQIGD